MKNMLSWAFVALVVWVLVFILHAVNSHAQTHCQLINRSFPEIQMSFVSKHCWETITPGKIIWDKTPLPKRVVISVAPGTEVWLTNPIVKPRMKSEVRGLVVKVKARKVAHRGACGSKRAVWRTLKNGHRKYRCK